MSQDLVTQPEKENLNIKQARRKSVNCPQSISPYPIKDDEEPIAKSSTSVQKKKTLRHSTS